MAAREFSEVNTGARRRVDGDTDWIFRRLPVVHRGMEETYGLPIFRSYVSSSYRLQHEGLRSFLDPMRLVTQAREEALASQQTKDASAPSSSTWPQLVSQDVHERCLSNFREGTNIAVSLTCAVCSRRTFTQDLLFTKESLTCRRVVSSSLPLELLRIVDEHILARPGGHFEFDDPLLNGIALDRKGVHCDTNPTSIDVCSECHSALSSKKPRLPALSMANGNIRGWLPSHLQDCTWFEERLCARYLGSACVVRLYDLTSPGAPAERPRVMKGHSCAFPLNTVATATKLPWGIGDGDALVSCIVIGPRQPRLSDLRHVFKVRRKKVHDLLQFLRANFKDYPQFPIDEDTLNDLPEDGVPTSIMRCVGYNPSDNPRSLFDSETTGIQPHPALEGDEEDDDLHGQTFLEHHGLVDVSGARIPSSERMANALANSTGTDRPDLVIKHGTRFIKEYDNPGLFPGMFPTLFPWGIGGFEDHDHREERLSLKRQGSYLLDLADSSFRKHISFVFVLCNIIQRRAIHIGSRFVCKMRDFDAVSKTIKMLDPKMVKDISKHLMDGGRISDLTPDENRILTLLKKCEIVSANVSGSKAAMNRARADIRSYVGQFGVFQLFLTLTPSTAHAPGFHVFYGDTGVHLDVRTPDLPSSSMCGIRLADDPVAATDYFHFHIAAVFKYLFEYDMRTKTSSEEGGILGRLKAYFLVKEHTMRGQLHGHILLWLDGGLNPSDLRVLMRDDLEFRERYLAFYDDLIKHELPIAPATSTQPTEPVQDPRRQRPPDPSDPDFKNVFAVDHQLLGELVQRHKCRFTCLKGGRKSCRFLFPHEVHPEPTFDPDSNSISPRVRDPTINWHNPTILVAVRHNHDLKAVQSGRSGVAAASYITSYATKSDETPANQISMINTVYERMSANNETPDDVKALLSRCVMQFGRERQLHAQQVVTYVRDLGDTWYSHNTIPMLSGRMILTAELRYGRAVNGADPESDSKNNTGGSDQDQSHTEGVDLPAATMQHRDEPDAGTIDPLSSTGGWSAPADVDDAGEDVFSDEDDELLPVSASGKAHQIDDYLHRGATLSDLCFYEFVQYCKLTPLPKRPKKNHHLVKTSHPNVDTMCHRYTPHTPLGIPRAIFSRMPRSDGTPTHGESYCLAMLSHFKPFGIDIPLKQPDNTYEAAFARYPFSASSKMVMANWAALTEGDDARDAEQLLRRKRESVRDAEQEKDTIATLQGGLGADSATADVDIQALVHKRKKACQATLEYTKTLNNAGWFVAGEAGRESATSDSAPCPAFSLVRRRKWAKEIKAREAQSRDSASIPKATTGVLSQDLGMSDQAAAPSTSVGPAILSDIIFQPTTEQVINKDTPPSELIDQLVVERKLNRAQTMAFTIAAKHFFTELSGAVVPPLRLLMHGEGGTGKTVVVRLLRELLERYGKGNAILFMAPTGKAAAAIGGSTQHAAFALHVHKRNVTTEELGSAHQDDITPRRIQFLQNKLQGISWVFFDEVSMTSCETMAAIDQSLRIGKQNLETAFGGVNVMFAGDLCELPPVGSSPLYRIYTSRTLPSDRRCKAQLGRGVWKEIKTVVEFSEQMRMQDPEMAATLSRLRLRKCIAEDADLLNGNVLRSDARPNGVNLDGRPEVMVLTRTNEAVRTLNQYKAAIHGATAGTVVDNSFADDTTDDTMTAEQRTALLSYHGPTGSKTGLGRLPLFVGMPVVFRGGNLSVDLGVTNGAFATVAGYDLVQDKWGLKIARGLLLKFPRLTDMTLTGLPEGCYPVTPTASRFSFRDRSDGPVTRVTRRQLPIQPGFAMTVHSAQGITATNGVVVDLRKGGFEAYVAASRATTRGNLFLFAPVQLKELNSPALPHELSKELKRLAVLAEETQRLYDSGLQQRESLAAKRPGEQDLNSPAKRRRSSSQRLPLSPLLLQPLYQSNS
ncbi:hypothetical protein CF326_g4481 [Tilletia indica]|uniref:ATP-dependent DNA helicase n=1 Tax=Tilletia indica TaxID=43049 RepID=A0A177TN98_9BASI|nr:hypothetical protein CF326_g4481 [Tilletia indica]KAE8244558.1 hypothetical protein A4X13_0g6494 [Tilletia indica]